ncbi:hypothetical protein BJF79_21710 [Actinomadura sp. CNU-125]|uniref:hypothetical protein n=1 Tax=Actinomadura sp. CNU-125 TaxID=1904961 RepID=UPI0009690AE4|nr:hypothetical protein [Actinomadura sp. CNU-125]OLT12718.1 hypothetical protein BJF79_21710 [Actinomadura sp. CNU-125]
MRERFSWHQAQDLIEKHTGPALSARPVQEGYNSQIAVVINDTTFVKGLRTEHPRAWTQDRERQINPHVHHVSARLLWSDTTSDWDLNGFEYLHGRQPDYAPTGRDADPIIAMMTKFPPAPADVALKQAPDRWASYSDRAELFTGDWLCHTDWSPGNILLSGDRARMLDWAWPTQGARWIDPACWIIWLIASGHHPALAQTRASALSAFATAPPAAVTAFASAQAAMWEDIGESAPHPGLAAAAARWVRHRTS